MERDPVLVATGEHRSDSGFPAMHGKGMRADTPKYLRPQDQQPIPKLLRYYLFWRPLWSKWTGSKGMA